MALNVSQVTGEAVGKGDGSGVTGELVEKGEGGGELVNGFAVDGLVVGLTGAAEGLAVDGEHRRMT